MCRLRLYQDLHFEYDVRGNVTRRTSGNQKTGTQEVLDLTWNTDHQLIESHTTRHGVTQATRYAYDPLGRRVSKSDAFGSTHYLWDGDLMEHSQRGTRQALYIYESGSFVPLATIQGAGEEHSTYWYQCDQIGAPLELTNEQGQGVWAAPRPTLGLLVAASHCGTEHLKNQSRLPDLICRHTIPFAKGKCIIEAHTVGYITLPL